MKIEIDDELVQHIKNALMVEFLKDDLGDAKRNLAEDYHLEDAKYNKKLIKAYKTILKYYGVDYERMPFNISD
jgi:hypothetical protein